MPSWYVINFLMILVDTPVAWIKVFDNIWLQKLTTVKKRLIIHTICHSTKPLLSERATFRDQEACISITTALELTLKTCLISCTYRETKEDSVHQAHRQKFGLSPKIIFLTDQHLVGP